MKPVTIPVTFAYEFDFRDRVEKLRKKYGFTSTSEVVQYALDKFDLSKVKPDPAEQMQTSVRLPKPQLVALRKTARANQRSVSDLLRMAVEAA